MILHADIDAFFASVEQVRDPRLKGRPVVVGGQPGERSVIASCSYEARRFGLFAGMPLREAARLCPRAVFLTGSYPVYREYSEKIFALLLDLSPAVEVVSLDEAYVDLEGAERVHRGSFWRAAQHLRRRARAETGLALSVGLGPSRVVAKLATACAKPDGIAIVPPDHAQDFLSSLPIGALPGIGKTTRELLARLRIERVGDFARLGEELPVETFGERGRTLARLARGQDPHPVRTDTRPKSVSRRSALHRPTTDRGLLEGYLFYLCERAAVGLRAVGARARTVRLHFEYDDHKVRERAITLAEPTDGERTLFETARALFSRLHDRRVRIRRIGVDASQLVFGAARQATLLDTARAGRFAALTDAVARIRERHGFHRVVQGPSVSLLGELEQDRHGFRLRTASLTR